MKRLLVLFWFSTIIAALAFGQSGEGKIDRQLEQLSKALVKSYEKLEQAKYRNTVVVSDFENASIVAEQNNLGYAFSELLTEYLVKNVRSFRVVERKQLSKVLDELELSLSDLSSQDNVIQVGNFSGADLLIIGSVFELGDNIQVITKLVETENAQILLSESIQIPRSAFIKASQKIILLRNTASLQYGLALLTNYYFSQSSLSYTYHFASGLSLGLELFFAFSHKDYEQTETKFVGPWDEIYHVASKVKLLGFGILLGYKYPHLQHWDIQYFIGPVFASYIDETTLVDFTDGGTTTYSDGQTISNLIIMIGLQGGLVLHVHVARSLDLFIGGHYQYFPGNTVTKKFEYQNPTMPPNPQTFEYDEELILSGPVIRLGVKYSF